MGESTLKPAAIKLEKVQALGINLKTSQISLSNIFDKFTLDLEFGPASLSLSDVPEGSDLKHQFGVIFKIAISGEDKANSLMVEMIAVFSSSEEVTEEFLQSAFAKVNAPAIAFPYVRSFISTLTLNAGYSPVILPAYNFSGISPKLDEPKI